MIALTAGCIGDSEDSEPEVSAVTRLNRLSVANHHHEPLAVAVEVEWDGEVVHTSEHELDSYREEDDSILIDRVEVARDWPTEPGSWTVSIRPADADWNSISSEQATTDCTEISGDVKFDGESFYISWWENLDATC